MGHIRRILNHRTACGLLHMTHAHITEKHQHWGWRRRRPLPALQLWRDGSSITSSHITSPPPTLHSTPAHYCFSRRDLLDLCDNQEGR